MKSPGINYPPPLWFVVPGIAGWLAGRWLPLPVVAGTWAPPVFAAGCLLVLLGSVLIAWGLATFLRRRTGIYPNRPAAEMVESGPFRFSRNPMYTGLAIATAGFGLVLNSGWVLLVAPLALSAVYFFVVRREEAYLKEKFGEEYEAYRSRVRRWL